MNITVSRKDLANLTTRLAGVADRKSSMPILANALLVADGKTLTGSATDMFLSAVDSVPAEGKPGRVAVSAHDLLARIKVLPDGPVTLSATDRALTVKSKGSARRFTLPIVNADDFPTLPQPSPDAPILKVESPTLAGLIASTAHAIATDETRPHLASLLVEWEGDTLRTVSTDGHRLALDARKVEGHASTTMLVPLRAVTELRRVLDETDGAVTIVLAGSQVFVTVGTLTLSAKTTDAQFPPWQQVIPANNPHAVRIARAPLADAIKAVSVAAKEKTGGIKFTFEGGKVLLTSESPESGEGVDEVPCEYDGPKVVVGFNGKYVLDALAAAQSDEVELALNGELDPMLLRPVGDEGFVGVVMPMRV